MKKLKPQKDHAILKTKPQKVVPEAFEKVALLVIHGL